MAHPSGRPGPTVVESVATTNRHGAHLREAAGPSRGWWTFEYIFETDEQNGPKAVSQEKAVEIAADWVTVFITCRPE